MKKSKERLIVNIDIITQQLYDSLNENNELTDWDYMRLINSFDRFQELIKLINIKSDLYNRR